ncbi:MAG: YVTN family beta-propeller repeat protein [Actinomycetota bacterium]
MSPCRLLAAVALALAVASATSTGMAAPEPNGSQPVRLDSTGTSALPSSAPEAGPDLSALVWVAVEGAERVAEVDVAAGRVIERIETPGGPHNITVARYGSVAVALWASDRIAIVRNGDVEFVELGGAPHDVKIAGNLVVVANQGSARVQLVRFDGRLRRTIPLVTDPHDVAVDPTGRRAWVSLEGRDDLAVVNLVRRARVRYVSTGERPHDLLFAPDGNLWVTDWAGELHVFSTPKGELLRSIELGVEAHHLAFTPDGRFAWITDHGAARVFVVRVRTLRVVASLRFPGAPHHVAITADGRWAVVADHDHGRLIVYNERTRRRVDQITVGAGPHGVWAVPV